MVEADTEFLLWSPTEQPTRVHRYELNGQSQQTLVTGLEHWFHAFGKARNTVVHDGATGLLSYDEPDFAYQGPMLWTGERLLREAMKVTLGLPRAYLARFEEGRLTWPGTTVPSGHPGRTDGPRG